VIGDMIATLKDLRCSATLRQCTCDRALLGADQAAIDRLARSLTS
jgi:hypothetical protein